MKFVIITHVIHIKKKDAFYAYAPYVREMNIWAKNVDEILLVAPISKNETSDIQIEYTNKNITLFNIPSISLTSFWEVLKSILYFPFIVSKIFIAMYKADHIHLRCPGNIGLIGCMLQVLFPSKTKTAKYAGNWDPKSKQPISYLFQKWLISNTFFTKKMQVLVYGDWSNQTKNIKPFFTASYTKKRIEENRIREYSSPLQFLFVGTLSPGKRPLYALQMVEQLLEKGIECRLSFFGEGIERAILEQYIVDHKLTNYIQLHGNQSAKEIEIAYKESDFLLLPSKSEGWPKVIAEAMFFGVIPLVTKISCVPWMLNFGKRGVLIDMDLEKDVELILKELKNKSQLQLMAEKAQIWSHQYTLDKFESEIKELL